MLVDDFKSRYTTIPFATYSRNHKKNTKSKDIYSLLHMHKEIEIFLVLSGEAMVDIDSKSYTIKEGDIVMISPYSLHRYKIFADKDIKHYCLCFDAELLYDSQFKSDLEIGNTPLPHLINGIPLYAEYIKNAYKAHKENKDGWELKVIGNLSLFFGELKEKGYINKKNNLKKQSVYSQIFNYISENYSENITSSDVAEYLNLNASYFCRLFKRIFGENFQNYLCKFRIEKAKHMLKYSDKSISQVALDSGFNSFSYFSKKFKEYIGITPSEYIKRVEV